MKIIQGLKRLSMLFIVSAILFINVIPSFAETPYTITATADQNGSITPSGTTTVAYGDSQRYTIAANDGYVVADVVVDYISRGSITSWPFNYVTAPHIISASFVAAPLYANFSGGGIWKWDGATWSQLTSNPTLQSMVTSGNNLYGAYENQGIWQWDGSSWTQLTPYTPQSMVTSGNNLYGSYEGQGIWKWDGSSWIQVTPNTPQLMAASGSTLYGAYNGNSIWKWDGLTWTQIAGGVATPLLMGATATTLYGAFDGFGIWQWDGSTWSQLTPNTPEAMTASGSALYGDYGSQGIWKWDGSAWSQITTNNPTGMVTDGYSFTGVNLSITATAGSNGSITPSGTIKLPYGASQTFFITPAAGYKIADVVVDETDHRGAVESYRFSDVKDNHTISASFVSSIVDITIDYLTDGASINGNSVIVAGSIANAANVETGVTVNGIAATLINNQFSVNNVPLTAGQNTITVTVTDANGKITTKTITVNATIPDNYIKLSANTDSGVAPLEIVLTINGSFSVTNPVITSTGPGTVEQLASDKSDEFKYKMTTEGVYYYTAQATGPDGNTYQDTIAITVLPLTQADTRLRTKWALLTNALQNKDITTALTVMLPASRDRYQTMFNLLTNQLPAIVATQTELVLDSIKGDFAFYELKTLENGTVYSYPVIFVKDRSTGLWLIQEF